MTDTNTDPTQTTVGVPQPGGPVVGSTDGTQPTRPDPASDLGVNLEGMSSEQIDALAARIEERRANRPPSVAAQLEALRQEIAGTSEQAQQAQQARQAAKGEASSLEQKLDAAVRTLRKVELTEAAVAAGFKNPSVVADILADRDGDVTELVAQQAASGAWAMNTPAPSAQIGGPASTNGPRRDPGLAALEEEIRKVQGR